LRLQSGHDLSRRQHLPLVHPGQLIAGRAVAQIFHHDRVIRRIGQRVIDLRQPHVHAAGHLAIKADFALEGVKLLPQSAKDLIRRLDLHHHRGRGTAFDRVGPVV
jgi:hypothetical protein